MDKYEYYSEIGLQILASNLWLRQRFRVQHSCKKLDLLLTLKSKNMLKIFEPSVFQLLHWSGYILFGMIRYFAQRGATSKNEQVHSKRSYTWIICKCNGTLLKHAAFDSIDFLCVCLKWQSFIAPLLSLKKKLKQIVDFNFSNRPKHIYLSDCFFFLLFIIQIPHFFCWNM